MALGKVEPFNIETFNIVPLQLIEFFDRYVVGQDAAKEVLAVSFCDHYARLKYRAVQGRKYDHTIRREKPNVLLVGPSGCGKTTLLKLAAGIIGVPYVIEDLTSYTEAGYYGEDIDNVPRNLLVAANGDIELAQIGVVAFDEFDKIASYGGNGRDVSGEGVQEALLRLIEGKELSIQSNKSRRNNEDDEIISTNDMLFTFAGAFEGLADVIKKHRNTVGFGNSGNTAEAASTSLRRKLQEYGIIPQLTGRIPNIVELNQLSQDDLYQILIKPTCSAVVTRIEEFAGLGKGIHLRFEEEAFEEIAKGLVAQNEGARNLSSILSSLLREAKMKLPSTNCRELIVTRDYVRDPSVAVATLLEKYPIKNFVHLGIRTIKAPIIPEKRGRKIFPRTEDEYVAQLVELGVDENYHQVAARYGLATDIAPSEIPETLKTTSEELEEAVCAMSEHYNIEFELDTAARTRLELLSLEREGIDITILLQECVGTYIYYDEKFKEAVVGGEKTIILTEEALDTPLNFF